jgi:hypothetical protein
MYNLRISSGKIPVREKLAHIVQCVGTHLLSSNTTDDFGINIDYGTDPTNLTPRGLIVKTTSQDVARLCINRWGAAYC